MVLSNKKLKQKLRTDLTKSITLTVAGNPSDESIEAVVKSQSLSLKELMGSVTRKPRLSKREKIRQNRPLKAPELAEGGNNVTQDEKNEIPLEGLGKKKKRKRKRDENGDQNGESGKSVLTETNPVKKSPKKKKKKKKKRKKQKKNNEEKVVETGGGESKEGVAKTVETNESQESGDAATKAYVGGIPYYSTEDDIRSFFEGCGTITEIDCMRFPESGKFRGIAMITFKTEAAAKRALNLDGADMGGLFLKIQPYKATRSEKSFNFAPEMVEGFNRVYVGNLSWEITEEDLRKFFSDCKISCIRFGEDKETGEFLGYAHVHFSDRDSLDMALTLDQKLVCGRPARVSCAVSKKEKETRPRSQPSDSSKKIGNGDPSGGGGSGSAKKRRTCYECGVPGHLSSACPKKKNGAEPVSI